MCKFCAMSPHPQRQNKNDFSWNHFTFIAFFKKKKTFKSRDGIKGKNSISQQAALLSEHSRVCAKKAWDIKNKTKTNKRLPTALEQKHSSCTSSIHGLEFLAYTFNKECRSGWRTSCLLTFQHLPSTRMSCWKATRCVLSESLTKSRAC